MSEDGVVVASNTDNTVNLLGKPETQIAVSKHVDVKSFEHNGMEYVGKAYIPILESKPEEGEDRDTFYAKRFEKSLDWIKNDRKLQESVKGSIPVKAPEEHYVIQQDEQGMPYPVKYQEKITGKRISEVNELDPKTRGQLKLLLEENRKYFLRTGKCFELIGSPPIGEKSGKLQKFLHPLRSSTNLLITPENDVVLVDPHSGAANVKEWFKFIAFESEYWKMVLSDRLNRKSTEPVPHTTI